MKKIYIVLALILMTVAIAKSQPVIWQQGFESADTANLPAGWVNYNNSPGDTIEPQWNWTVRTVGTNLPGLATSLSVVHSGTKSCGVSWWTGQGTGVSDCWLVTPRLQNVPNDAIFSFWMTGGSPSFSDSCSVWISTGANTPAAFLSNPSNEIQNIFFPVGTTYGNYEQFFVDLSTFAGQSVYIGFRYNMDVAVNGYYVQLDDVEYQGTVGITQNGTNIPEKFSLEQNYPNPFNPTTKINFDLAKSSNVRLVIFNSLGQEVETIFEGVKPAGSYQADFNGSSLSSGTYYYRLETDYYTETKKMQLVK